MLLDVGLEILLEVLAVGVLRRHCLDPVFEIFQLRARVKNYDAEERADGRVTEAGNRRHENLAGDGDLVKRRAISVEPVNRLESEDTTASGVREVRDRPQSEPQNRCRMINDYRRRYHDETADSYDSRDSRVLQHHRPLGRGFTLCPVALHRLDYRDDHYDNNNECPQEK